MVDEQLDVVVPAFERASTLFDCGLELAVLSEADERVQRGEAPVGVGDVRVGVELEERSEGGFWLVELLVDARGLEGAVGIVRAKLEPALISPGSRAGVTRGVPVVAERLPRSKPGRGLFCEADEQRLKVWAGERISEELLELTDDGTS